MSNAKPEGFTLRPAQLSDVLAIYDRIIGGLYQKILPSGVIGPLSRPILIPRSTLLPG
jgi:hypothetical protein